MLAAMGGQTLESIGKDFSITKARVGQILGLYNIDTRSLRTQKRMTMLSNLAETINKELSEGISEKIIRSKYNLNSYDVKMFATIGVDLRIHKKEVIKKVNSDCTKLYKKGFTAYEIIDLVPQIKTAARVYRAIGATDIDLSKRVNHRTKNAIKLKKEIVKLKKNHTFTEVLEILQKNDVKNLNGGKMRLETVIYNHYKK